MFSERTFERFLVVAEERSVSQAARRLQLPTTTVARTLAELETVVGVKLFDRSRQGVLLTKAGQAFALEVEAALQQMRRAREAARRVSLGDAPSLRVGHVTAGSYLVLPIALRGLSSQVPSVSTWLTEGLSGDLTSALLAGRLDLALLHPPVVSDQLVEEAILEEPLAVALPAGHPLASRAHVALEDLRGADIIGFPRDHSPGSFDRWLAIFRKVGCEPTLLQHQSSHPASLLVQVAAGLGAALIPAGFDAFRSVPGVEIRPLAPPAPTIALSMAWLAHDPNPLVKVLVDELRASASRHSYAEL